MKRRDFCKLMAAGAAGLFILNPAFPREAESKTSEDWMKWFCDHCPPERPSFTVTDSHFHFYDFIQRTDGAKALIECMNENGVEHIMFSGMPLTKKWDRYDHQAPVYYLDNNSRAYWYSATDMLLAGTVFKDIPEEDRYRFHPFICGFNSTDMYAVEHVERMLDAYEDGFWHGIGEAFAHRDDLTNLTFGETAQADHPALMKIYDLAGRKDLPVTIHNNVSSRGRQMELLYRIEVERAVSKHPHTRFIWAHAGLSRYFDDIDQAGYTAELGTMLENHPNLHIDLSWLVFENYVAPDPFQGPSPCWLDVIQSFPDRFMIGTDCIGHFNMDKLDCPDGPKDPARMKYAFNIRKYYVLLEKLSRADSRLVGRENFLNLLPQKVKASMT